MSTRAIAARASALALLLVVTLIGPAAFGRSTASATPPGPPPSPVTGLEIAPGLSVLLAEASTGQVIVARDAEVRRPIASAIKLVTALTVVDELQSGHLVEIGDEVRGIEGSSYDLRPGEVREVDDLLAGLLLRSGNDAAVALALAVAGSEEAFVDRMAATLSALGVEARPGSSSGLALADALSAAELATVARAALTEPRIRRLVGVPTLVLRDGLEVENRNLFLSDTEGATGLKTGFTSAAGYTLAASARRDGRELIAVVLGASDDLERRAVAARLLDFGFSSTRVVPVTSSVTLRTSRGPVRFATVATDVTIGLDSAVHVDWSRALRPEDTLQLVELRIDELPAGVLDVERRDGRRDGAAAGLGAALTDGVYSALRPFALAGGAGTTVR
jgi:D-alanyl-D-alanine carboxypeptidase (penicillin-binding protein 5/6)